MLNTISVRFTFNNFVLLLVLSTTSRRSNKRGKSSAGETRIRTRLNFDHGEKTILNKHFSETYKARTSVCLLFFPHRGTSRKHNFAEFLTELKIRLALNCSPITTWIYEFLPSGISIGFLVVPRSAKIRRFKGSERSLRRPEHLISFRRRMLGQTRQKILLVLWIILPFQVNSENRLIKNFRFTNGILFRFKTIMGEIFFVVTPYTL